MCAHLVNSSSRNSWALEKARVETWGTFPPGKAGTMDVATCSKVPSWRSCILQDSGRLPVTSAVHWVGQGRISIQWHDRESHKD